MSDISTVWNGTHGDWVLAGPVLGSGNDLQTAVLISLFSDREATTDDVIPDGTADPRGWWADDDTVPIGSRLWLIFRSTLTQATLGAAKNYAEQALQWLVDDGVCARFDVYVEWQVRSRLAMRVTIFKSDGTQQSLAYVWAWNGA